MVRKKITADELSARAKANGYQRGAHRDKDSLQDKNKHVDKVKKDQDAALHRHLTDIRSALAPEKCWHQKRASTRKGLTPEVLWHQKSAGTRKALAPANAK
jgi:hypothetical protein